ncbi:putative HTH-type transcriptional regulator YfiR [compost metagenome]
MQVLKDEVKAAILAAACNEFLEKGYNKTSMRDIARHAGISAGNLYRYYSNKEELFYAITTPVYNLLLALSEHQSGTMQEKPQPTWEQMVILIGQFMSRLLRENRKALLILLDGSAGTKYADAKNQIVAVFAEHVQEHLAKRTHVTNHLAQSFGDADRLTARPLAVSFLEGLFEIMRLYEDEELINICTMQYVDMLFQGLGKLVK